MEWKAQLSRSLAKKAGVSIDAAAKSLMMPQGAQADWCSTIAFSLAKERGQSPVMIAKSLEGGDWPDFISSAKALGPYLNFNFTSKFWAGIVKAASSEDKQPASLECAEGAEKSGRLALIEFPSVNPNKPWHVGHLRNALLGDSLARLLASDGMRIIRLDYIDDLGLQVAQSIWGRKNLPEPSVPSGSEHFASKFDHRLGWQYVAVAKKVEDRKVEGEVRELLHKLEAGDEEVSSDARAVVEKCVAAQYQTAFSFGIRHDLLIFESDIVRTIFDEGMKKISSSGAIIKESEGKNAGCVVVKLEGEKEFEGMESPDKVLVRSDGTATYTGKDVIFALWKFGQLKNNFRYSDFIMQPDGTTALMSSKDGGKQLIVSSPQMVVNVIGMEQAYPQKVICAVMRKMGLTAQAGNFIHLAYEHVVLPEGRFSGRKGTWMAGSGASEGDASEGKGGFAPAGAQASRGFTADDLLHEVELGALQKVRAEESEEAKQKIARAVAVAAIRFSFLRTSASQKIVFDYDKALSLSGDSGPYLQYAYARSLHIIQKARTLGIKPALDENYKFNEQEIALLRAALKWGDVVHSSAAKCQVHPIADYSIELAARFNQFYTTTQVVDTANPSASSMRLMEVRAFANTLGAAMDILGIPRLEKM